MDTDYLDWALTDFSGYIAVDELYDGPFCVLSIVDNRTYKRLFYRVLDHTPAHEDLADFFRCFQAVLQARQLMVKGIPTDGSPLYPAPIAAVWGDVPHQLCEFPILADLSRAVLSAVAQVRKSLEARQPQVGRGRPTARTRKLVQQRQRLEQKISDRFTHRYLFVQRQRTASEQETFRQITRGLP